MCVDTCSVTGHDLLSHIMFLLLLLYTNAGKDLVLDLGKSGLTTHSFWSLFQSHSPSVSLLTIYHFWSLFKPHSPSVSLHTIYHFLPPHHNLGIGKFIALDFARRGARVILACRSEARGNAAVREVRQLSGNADVHLRLVDVSSLESVREFATNILREEKEVHILVNNAGASGTVSAGRI